MKQTNKQAVAFQKGKQWYANNVNLKDIYNSVHARHSEYGTSANVLINEMLANLCELAHQEKINLTQPFIITDYGCGRSKAANILAEIVSEKAFELDNMLRDGKSYGEIFNRLSASIKAADTKEISELHQIMHYKHITVQRFDIGVPEFSKPLEQRADVVFCNDVFEHIPLADIPSFIQDLENSGKYVIASISLRDAVNYNKISEDILEKDAVVLTEKPKGGIILTKDISGAYIFSLHVTIMPQNKWQDVLGSRWTLLPAQDYTACSAMNFVPSLAYQNYKRELISQIGFADFIGFPTRVGTPYEQDSILFRRTALMQPLKHLYKLNALDEYPDSDFSRRERAESLAFLRFIGGTPSKNKETGLWEFAQELPADCLSKLYALEHLSKRDGNMTDEQVKVAADAIIKEYNDGNTKMVDDFVNDMA